MSKELTQARAIEYIVNYQYKRNLNTKSSIKVLEIEPAKTGSTLDQNTVLGWLGKKTNDPIDIDTVIADCEQNSGNEKHPASNICLLYTSPSPRDDTLSRMPSSA